MSDKMEKNENQVPVEEFVEVMPLVEVDARRLSRAVREGGETKKCECGEVNDPVSKFCKNCGKPLSKKCPDCGNDNDPTAQYCSNCGRRF